MFAYFGLNAQNIDNQFFVYTENPQANAAVFNAANLLSSVVVEYSGPNQHLALLEWDGNPFTYGSLTINSMVQIMSVIKGNTTEPKPVEIDGGTLNRLYNPSKSIPSGKGGNCSNSGPTPKVNGTAVTMGIFDTGLNYDVAIHQGYRFSHVTEIGGSVTDNHGHGTHVGTIIDEVYHDYVENNDLSYVIGSSFDNQGQSTLYGLVSSVEDALHLGGIDIMNFSFTYPVDVGSSEQTDAFYLLLSSSIAQDVLFVCAAGNDNVNIDPNSPVDADKRIYYPAAFSLPTVLSVGSYYCLAPNLSKKSTFSNYGTETVDFAAPGENIMAMDHEGAMVPMTGTSQATAIVSASAAVLKSKFPQFEAEMIKCVLLTMGNPSQYLNQYFKYGRELDLKNILNSTQVICNPEPSPLLGLALNNTVTTSSPIVASPNPFVNDVTISVVSEVKTDALFEVFDISGSLVLSFKDQLQRGSNELNVNFDNVAHSNQYIIRIITDDNIHTTRLVRLGY